MSIDLSLDRIRVLSSHFVAYSRPTIHIAGTNGKGSVAAFIASTLKEAGFRTGRYNSPHLVEVRDAINLDGSPLAQQTYIYARQRVEEANQRHGIQASTFELLTATAFLVFEESQIDIAVVEVGMGGRLDATNVIPDDCILISAITSIDLDHQAFLGSTIQSIATEKAGILRAKKMCIIGEQPWPEVLPVFERIVNHLSGILVVTRAAEHRAWTDEFEQTHFVGKIPITAFPEASRPLKLVLPLPGKHQLANVAIAVSVLSSLPSPYSNRLTDSVIVSGIANTTWPGRLDTVQYSTPRKHITVIADGAHNAGSAKALQLYLTSRPDLPKPRTFILGLSHSPPKTPLQTLSPLLLVGDRVGIVSFNPVADMPWVKPVDTLELATAANELVGVSGVVNTSFHSLEQALDWAAEGNDIVILAGSLYLVADFYRLLPERSIKGAGERL